MKANIHLYQSPFRNESRILKEIETLREAKLVESILVVGVWEPGLNVNEQLHDKARVWRIPLLFRTNRFRFIRAFYLAEWCIKIIARLWHTPIGIIQAHSLIALGPAVILKFLTGAKLVFDAHELETETTGMSGLRKMISKIMERCLIRFVDHLLLVSDSIGNWYAKTYSLSPERWTVIKNVPMASKFGQCSVIDLKTKLGIPKDDVLFLYQGMLGFDRGIEELIDVFCGSPDGKRLLFMGHGPLADQVTTASRKCPSHIFCLPSMPPTEIASYTKGADVGFSVLKDSCLNHRLALPNKLFEYILCGLPVIVSNLPESKALVEELGCGWVAEPSNEGLSTIVKNIDLGKIAKMRPCFSEVTTRFCWEVEAPKLIAAYRKLFVPHQRSSSSPIEQIKSRLFN